MGFKYVEDARLVNSTLDFAELQNRRENCIAVNKPVFTEVPKDTRIKFVPSYLLEDGQDPNGESIVYHVDKSMPESLIIT